MKLVMLGGTFNPPHNGHIVMADMVRRSCGYDKVILVPAFQPAHKEIETGVSPSQRLEMTRLAAQEIENVLISDCELVRQGVSYSLDTVRYLKKHFHLKDNPGLIIGDDLIPGFSKWHNVHELVLEADLILLHRGNPDDLIFPYPHRYINNEMIPISSSEVRAMVRDRLDITGLVPLSVAEYIRKQGLYLG